MYFSCSKCSTESLEMIMYYIYYKRQGDLQLGKSVLVIDVSAPRRYNTCKIRASAKSMMDMSKVYFQNIFEEEIFNILRVK